MNCSMKKLKKPKAKKQKTYEVEKVVDSKGSGKNVEYLVKWEGFPSSENTWEPAANLASCKEVCPTFTASARDARR